MIDLLSMFFNPPLKKVSAKQEPKGKSKRRKAKRMIEKAKRQIEKEKKAKRRQKKRLIERQMCDSDSSSSSDEDECLDKHHNAPDNSHKKNKVIEKLYDVIQQVDNKITCKTIQTNMEDYFICDPCTGILTPKFIQMNVNDTIINVPAYTLVNHTNMNVKDFKCKFKTDAYNLGLHSRKNFDIETEVTFTRDNVNDGYIRINELLIKDNF
jgi:hypothetical protein